MVGAVASRSGAHARAGTEYRQGLLLWQAQANQAGGLLGRPVELRIEDDGSEGAKAGRLTAELIKGGAQVLIGPYGSAASLVVAAEAERSRRVMLNVGGRSALVQRRATRYVFQVIAPYAAYADGVLAVAKAAGAQSLFILGRDDAASREMAEAAEAKARTSGFLHVALEIYSGQVVDFLPQLYHAMAVDADAWITFGEVRDAADMVKTLKRHGYVPRLFYARSSADARFIKLVGQDAEFVLGSEEYDARFATAGNAAFVQAFTTRWSAAPGAAAAAAYAAGTVLAAAAARSGSIETEKLRAALAELQVDTVLGTFRLEGETGAQAGIQPALTQIIRGKPMPVWPEALAAGRPLAAFANWTERKILK